MKKLLVNLFVFVSLNSFADVDPLMSEMKVNREAYSQTYFQQLVELYKKGVRPTEANLMGVHSGRAYVFEKPNDANGSYLACMDFSTGNPGKSKFGCINMGNSITTAYDNVNAAQIQPEALSLLIKFKVSFDMNSNEICNYNLKYLQDDWRGTECFRMNGDHIIYIVRKPSTHGPLGDIGPIIRAGYFFKKLQ